MTNRIQEIVERKQSPDGRAHEIRIDTIGHVPFNKRSWEADPKTRAILRVKDYDGSLKANPNPWVNIELTEVTFDSKGNARERTISVDIHEDQRDALIKMLSRDPQPVG